MPFLRNLIDQYWFDVTEWSPALRIWQRRQLHTVFNLGYCFHFTLAGCLSPFLFYTHGNLLSELMTSGNTSLVNCHLLGLLRFLLSFSSKVFLANLIFRYAIIKYSHYGMGLQLGGRVDTRGWVIKLLYFTFLFSYGLMSYLGLLLKFYEKEKTNTYVKGRICLLEK